MSRKKVVLDPGHGGHDAGAVNRKFALEEADMALDVCKRAKDLLRPYVDVIMTREDDIFVSLAARPDLANQLGADAFVSYHFNSAGSPDTASSYEGFTTPGQNKSDLLCSAILRHHGRLSSSQKLRADRSDGDIDKEANFAVIRRTRCPSCLIEGEFIHTDHGALFIKDPENRQMMAEAVKLGVLEFFGISSAGLSDDDFSPRKKREAAIRNLEGIERDCRELRKYFQDDSDD